MAVKKRSTPGGRKRPRSAVSGANTSQKDSSSKNEKLQKSRVSDKAHSHLKYASIVLVFAIVLGVLWNKADSVDPKVSTFLSAICRKADCARFVSPQSRRLLAARPIRQGESLFEIPRDLQFWDIDALRDEYVRENLLKARHPQTQNPMATGAFLSAWLALKLNGSDETESDPARISYLQLLPKLEDLSEHPLLWEKEELVESFGGISLNLAVVMMYRDMVDSEYEAFRFVSGGEFAEKVTKIDYTVARINVLSRSFSPGAIANTEELESEELEFYKQYGLNFSEGCQAMVPILDMFNHHPNPNVGYKYSREKRAFVITAKKSIPSGFELFDTYGKFTDSHLFAKFGFVNGDGSGWTQASISAFHRVLDQGMDKEFSFLPYNGDSLDHVEKYQRRSLRRYLHYDDGYKDCIQGPDTHPEEFELKKLKLDHLLQIANKRKNWILNVSPRLPKSVPVESSDIVISEIVPEMDLRHQKINFSNLLNTCRVISVINSDYDGQATEILRNNLDNQTFALEKDPENDSLEYRSIYWYVSKKKIVHFCLSIIVGFLFILSTLHVVLLVYQVQYCYR